MRRATRGLIHSQKIQPNAPLGVRATPQRDAIVGVIALAKGPLSIPEIRERASQIRQGIGIATIYRTLKLLQQNGQLEPIILPTGEMGFEMPSKSPRQHFQCRQCHEVFTLSSCPPPLPNHAVLDDGFVVEEIELTLYGTCPVCVSRTPCAD